MTFARLGVAALLVALTSCSPTGTYVELKLDGAVGDTIAYFDVGLTLGTQSAFVRIGEGEAIALPTNAVLDIRSGEGNLIVTALAKDANGNTIAQALGSVDVVRGRTVKLPLFFGVVAPADMKLLDAMQDSL